MLFKIDIASPKPVYQQVIDQVKYAVASGRLRPGDRLDPIREVAVQARVNRNTIARAYMELEREGVINSRTGVGSFIAEAAVSPIGRAKARKILTDALDELLATAHQLQMKEEEFLELVRDRLSRINLNGD